MTLEEFKEEKKNLEETIAGLVNGFGEKTNVYVESVDVKIFDMMYKSVAEVDVRVDFNRNVNFD